ncbi:MAG: hypothetical protein EPN45_16015 [Rhizobiaceae bacterium]|nr:MAG: hypothetical protein EPN45_16015 [Rhizobiaceae bacterium]
MARPSAPDFWPDENIPRNLLQLITAHRVDVLNLFDGRTAPTSGIFLDNMKSHATDKGAWLKMLTHRPATRNEALEKLCYIASVVMIARNFLDGSQMNLVIQSVERFTRPNPK